MENFWDVLKARRSVRKFKSAKVPGADIRRMMEAATLAPSAGNKQNWQFIVVESGELISKMREAVQEVVDGLASRMSSPAAKKELLNYSDYLIFFAGAPLVIAVVMKPYDSMTMRLISRYASARAGGGRLRGQTEAAGVYKSSAGIQGVCAAIENLLLAACALGYGGCWMTGPMIARDKLEKLLGISPPDELLALIPVGLADGIPKMPPRKDINEVMAFK